MIYKEFGFKYYYFQLRISQMGNSYAPSKDLNFFIETQKPYYNSGSSIEGTVLVDVKKNFQFDALYIRIQGNQWCQWFEGSSKNRRKYTGSQNFYAVEHILHKFEGQFLQLGKYAYPFSLQLSDNIPGSYQSSEHQAKIQYNLIAYFVNYKEPKDSKFFQMPITIKQPFRQDIVRYSGQAVSTPKKFGFIDQGQIKLEVNFDRNVAFQGEDIALQIISDNSEGSVDIPRFKVQLVEYTFVSSNGNASRTYRRAVHTINLDQKVSKGESRAIDYTFRVPPVKHQTAISTLVANYYRLEVCTNLGMGSSKNPCIYAPLFILQKVDVKEQKKPNTNLDHYQVEKAVCIRSGDYLFKKNRNLDVYNFRQEDLVTQSNTSQSGFMMAS